MALALAGVDPRVGFDLRITDVIVYESLTIVVFDCECRWVLVLDRDPVLVRCPEHRRTWIGP